MPIEIHRDLRTPGGLSALGSAVPWVRRSATPRIAGDIACSALTTLALTASRVYWVPVCAPREVTLSGLRVSVTTASAGTASVGLYANAFVSGNDAPGTLIASADNLATGTTGDKTGSFSGSQTLAPGTLYWVAVIGSAAATVRALPIGAIASAMGRTANNTTAITHLFAAGSGSTLPASAPAVTAGTGSVPAIYLIEA